MYFIEDGVVFAEFSSESAITNETGLEANLTSLPLQFSLGPNPSSSPELHYSLTIYPQDMPPTAVLCAPQPGLIQEDSTHGERSQPATQPT